MDGLKDHTFQEWLLCLPIRLYGWGFRSLRDVCELANLGALETAISYMAGRGEHLAPQMEDVWGGEDQWGEEADTGVRWATLLESGCEEGTEVRRVWESLRPEQAAAQQWLGLKEETILSAAVEGIGEGSVSG